jgi:hypothetical protein
VRTAECAGLAAWGRVEAWGSSGMVWLGGGADGRRGAWRRCGAWIRLELGFLRAGDRRIGWMDG